MLDDCNVDIIAVLSKLVEGCHKALLTKLQYCQPQVEYLGRLIAHGSKSIVPAQLEGISKTLKPQTVGEMMIFLRITGFSLDWIKDYTVKVAPLHALMAQADSKNLPQWMHK